MNTWWGTQNPDDVYFICTFDWSGLGWPMPFATEIDDFYWDFGNGYVPFFAVIGAYNIFMYGDNDYQPALDMVPEAIASFDNMGVLNPIADQSLYYGDEVTFDVSDMFGHPSGEPVTVTLDGNTNPDIVDADVTDNILTLTAQNISGNSEITLLGSGGTQTCTYEFNVIVSNPDDNYVLILDLDPTPTGSVLQPVIENYYTAGDVHIVTDLTSFPLANADAVFVLLGIYSSNFVLTNAEADLLSTYLDGGGNVYMEGGDTWYYDTATSVHSYFNINGTTDGTSDLSNVNGYDFLDGMSWSYTGENNYIDHLVPIAPAVTIFSNPSPSYDCGVAYDSGTYKTVGTSFEITGLGGTNSLDDAVEGILNFFDIISGTDVEDPAIPAITKLGKNYPNPFNPVTNIAYSVQETGNVSLEVYNIKGQLVKTLVNETKETGDYTATWSGTDNTNKAVSSGVYFYKMKSGNYTSTKKMILMK